MDWLEFIASIVGSLAWPGVVLMFLWINRRHLANLLDWIEEFTLPGGVKFKFTKALTKATAQAGLLAAEGPGTQTKDRVDSAKLSVADQFPEATVVQSFIEIVETLGQMVRFLPLPTKGRDPMSVVKELARLGYIDQKSVSLFVNLRDAYTAAVREGYVRLSAEEGLSYLAAAQVLNTQLREVLRRLEVDNPRKREWGTQ